MTSRPFTLRLEQKVEALGQFNQLLSEQLAEAKKQNSYLRAIIADKVPLTTKIKFDNYCETYPWSPCAKVYDV
jgi:hypothetical protein